MNLNNMLARMRLIQIYSYQNRLEEARALTADALRIIPNFSLKLAEKSWIRGDKEAVNRALELLRKAGIPEE